MKKNLSMIAIAIFPAMILLNSCYPGPIYDPYDIPESRQAQNIYYVPSASNTQLLSEKNDVDINLVATAGSKFAGTELQASYLPGKHFGLIGGYSSAKDNGHDNFMKYHGIEGGVGYITHLSKGWHFETYAGMGSGKINNVHATGSSKTNYTRFFLQPGFAVSNAKRTMQFGIVSKFSGVNFKIDTAFDNAREHYSTIQAMSLYNTPFHIMWEPGVVFRVGWKNFLFHTGYSLSADLTNSNLNRAKDLFSIGASLRFNASAKKIAK